MGPSPRRRLAKAPPSGPERTALTIRQVARKQDWDSTDAIRLLVPRAADARRLSDTGALAILVTRADAETAAAAAQRHCELADRSLLIAEASRKAGDRGRLGEAALERLARTGDEAALANVASSGEDGSARRAAVSRLSDTRALARIARADAEAMVRAAAAERLLDPAVLQEIATKDVDDGVRYAARRRLETLPSNR